MSLVQRAEQVNLYNRIIIKNTTQNYGQGHTNFIKPFLFTVDP